MSAIESIKQLLIATKEKIRDTPPHLLASPEVRAQRMEICNNCEFLNKTFNRCTKCGCFMKAKVNLSFVACPVGKWDAEKD